MKLSDFVIREAILTDLKAASKESAIRSMVESLSSSGNIKGADRDGIIAAILKREELGSTGIGKGVAVPIAWWRRSPCRRRESSLRAWTAKTCTSCSCWCRLPTVRETICGPSRTFPAICGMIISVISSDRPRLRRP